MGLETIALVTALGSAAVSGVGAYQQGQAGKAAAGYNEQVAAQNAKLATQNADVTGAVGNQNVGVQGAKNKAQIGATLANEGASGVNVNSGSPVDVRQSEAKVGMLNELNIRSQAARQAYGFQTQSAADTGQSQLYKSQASSDNTASYLNAGAQVLGGVSKAAMYTNFLNSSGPLPDLTGEGGGGVA